MARWVRAAQRAGANLQSLKLLMTSSTTATGWVWKMASSICFAPLRHPFEGGGKGQ